MTSTAEPVGAEPLSAESVAGRRLPIAGGREVLARLWALSRGCRVSLAVACVLLLGAAALGLVFPLVIGWIVGAISDSGPSGGSALPEAFWQLLALLGAAVLGTGVLEFAGMLRLTHVVETMIAGLREEYVEQALDLPPDVVETVGVGDVVSRASSDIREISDIVPWVLPTLASAVFTLSLSFGAMALIDWRFAVGLVAALPLYGLAMRWYLRTSPGIYAALRAAESERSQHVLTTIQALPTVTAFRLGAARRQVVREATWRLVRWAMRAKILQNRLFGRSNTAECVGLLITVGVGFVLAASGAAGVGEVTAATLLFFRIVAPVDTLLFVIDDVQSAAASLARIVGVGSATRERAPLPAADPGLEPVVLRVTDLRFEYRRGHPVIDGICLSIAQGEHVAVVGESGAGKTTLARLLAGTCAPSGGRIDRAVPPDRIAYLTQEHHVFAGTLADNLTLARPSATAPEMTQAWETVAGRPLTDHFPEGLDTVLGEHALRVGPALAQQVALARLALGDAPVVILDEATAEADSRDSNALDAATRRVLHGRTAIVIAHRLDQAVHCDRVVVFDAGRIVEQGPHRELVQAGGRYAKLWAAWSAAKAR